MEKEKPSMTPLTRTENQSEEIQALIHPSISVKILSTLASIKEFPIHMIIGFLNIQTANNHWSLRPHLGFNALISMKEAFIMSPTNKNIQWLGHH